MKNTLLIMAFLLSACASGGAYQPAPVARDQTRIVIYRPFAAAGSLQSVLIRVDGAEKADLWGDGFLSIDIPPGNHEIKASTFLTSRSVKGAYKAGGIKYFIAGYADAGVVMLNKGFAPTGALHLSGVDEKDALEDLKKMHSED